MFWFLRFHLYPQTIVEVDTLHSYLKGIINIISSVHPRVQKSWQKQFTFRHEADSGHDGGEEESFENAGQGFFELSGDGQGGLGELEGCLEPEGLESDALEGQIIDEERVDFDGISEEEIPQELLHQVAAVQQQDSASGKQIKSAFSFSFCPNG